MNCLVARLLTLLVALTGLAALPVVPTAPAAAASGNTWSLDSRPAGTEPPTEPSRRLERAYLVVGYDLVSGSVQLAGVPDATTDSEIRVTLGRRGEDGACRVERLVGTTTYAPVRPNRRDEESVHLQLPVAQAVEPSRWTCVHLELVDADGTVLDHLDGHPTGSLVSDPVGSVRIGAVTGKQVVPGRWTYLEVRVANTGSDMKGVRVSGDGQHVRVEQALYLSPVYVRESVTVQVRVKLLRPGGAHLKLRAEPLGGFLSIRDDRRRVWVRPR